MTTTPILALDELASGQAIPEVTVNEAVRWLEFFGAGGKVLDRGLATPPGSPADGDAYLVAGSATGAWSGRDGDIALRISTAWAFKEAKEGMRLYVADEDVTIVYDGAAWSTVGGATLTAAADTDIWTGTSTAKAVTPDSLFDASAIQTLTDAATVTPDFGAGLNFKWTIGGNRTLANPTNAKDGQSGVIRITQDGTGSRVISYGSNWRFPGGAATGGVLSTAAGSVDQIAYIVGSTGLIYATLSKAFAA